ncbi:MAG: hypothetical protein SWY16_05285 [Cyanobacteriota bacterium]|nr:hypothetical protein [Cyanobacteriota bacterium]
MRALKIKNSLLSPSPRPRVPASPRPRVSFPRFSQFSPLRVIFSPTP